MAVMNERVAHPLAADPQSYGVDVHAWAAAQARLLRERRFESLDLDNIIEEIESLGNEQAHSVESHLIALVEHLLKLAISADVEPRRVWQTSVRNARNRIEIRLRRNPSLRPQLHDLLTTGWKTARDSAAGGLRAEEEPLLPASLPFTLAQILDSSYFPGSDRPRRAAA